ncbi:MAG: hypothetical protein V7646_1404 [Pseudonocardia sp.]|jgi:hypothetical protein
MRSVPWAPPRRGGAAAAASPERTTLPQLLHRDIQRAHPAGRTVIATPFSECVMEDLSKKSRRDRINVHAQAGPRTSLLCWTQLRRHLSTHGAGPAFPSPLATSTPRTPAHHEATVHVRAESIGSAGSRNAATSAARSRWRESAGPTAQVRGTIGLLWMGANGCLQEDWPTIQEAPAKRTDRRQRRWTRAGPRPVSQGVLPADPPTLTAARPAATQAVRRHGCAWQRSSRCCPGPSPRPPPDRVRPGSRAPGEPAPRAGR